MKTKTILLLTLVLLAASAPLALAQPGAGPGPRGCDGDGPGPFGGRLCDRLDLSEAQQAAIDEIREAGRAKGLETRKEIMRLKNELEGLMLQDDPDAGEAKALIRRIGELRTEQQVRRMETRMAVRAQLTDEQRDRMIAMMGAGKRGRGGPGHGPRFGGPGCDGHGARGEGRRGPRGR